MIYILHDLLYTLLTNVLGFWYIRSCRTLIINSREHACNGCFAGALFFWSPGPVKTMRQNDKSLKVAGHGGCLESVLLLGAVG